MFPRVGGSWFSRYILSVEGSADGSAPHLGCPKGGGPPHSVTVGGLDFGFVCAQCLLKLLLFVAWPLCFLLHL